MNITTRKIRTFLTNRTHHDLAGRYSDTMEIQVRVLREGRTPVGNKGGSLFRDQNGKTSWDFRFPRKGKPNHYYNLYDLDKHVEYIGLSGWDFGEQCSRYVAFDFDAITEHAAGVGISQSKLDEVRESAIQIPWVEVRRSTGGNGLHLYVTLANPPKTQSRDEHRAVARAILGKMSQEVGFDFDGLVDVYGGNMWIMGRRATAENKGLSLIKAAEYPLADLPSNWRSHIGVVRGQRTKTRIKGISDDEMSAIEAASLTRSVVPLDEGHVTFIKAVEQSGYTAIWEQDHHLLSTHTGGVKKVFDAVGLRGVFETISEGNDPGTPNCYLFPMSDSRWRVCRYGKGTTEAPTWTESANGWTTCVINEHATLEVVARIFNALDDPEGGCVFTSDNAAKAVAAMGESFEPPAWTTNREVILKPHREGLEAKIPYVKDDDKNRSSSYLLKRKQHWVKLFRSKPTQFGRSDELPPYLQRYDETVRHLVRETKDAGWYFKNKDGTWTQESRENIKSAMVAGGVRGEVNYQLVFGHHVDHPWTLVSLPFAEEYPGPRQWNKDAAKLAYQPSATPGPHPHWDMVLNHVGLGLDDAVARCSWCQRAGIRIGGDYLRQWAASMIRHPHLRLPYLFLFSKEQNTGKSAFHESLCLLMPGGWVEANNALRNKSDFNGELNGKVLAVVEETDLSKADGVYNKMKNWVTCNTIGIQFKHCDLVMMPNMTHWVQTANAQGHCPVEEGDERIVMIKVFPLLPDEEVPKDKLIEELKKEAPFFMRTLNDIQFAEPYGRLYLPVLETEEKVEAMPDTKQDESLTKRQLELADDVRTLVVQRVGFEGTATELAAALGGEWTGSTVGRFIRLLVDHLREKGIDVAFTGRTSESRDKIRLRPVPTVQLPTTDGSPDTSDSLQTAP